MSFFERQLLTLLQRTQTPLEDDDESFFRSLAPALAALDPHHKLLFRTRVLATALQIQVTHHLLMSIMNNSQTLQSIQNKDRLI